MSDLSVWLSNHSETLKSFAGPIATVIAATVAARVAIRLGKSQVAIARAQKDIAFDKLKLDLFEKRYAIYLSLKELIEYVTASNPSAPIDATLVRTLYVKLDEARFFFDGPVIKFINETCAAAEAYFNLRAERAVANPNDSEKWAWFADQLAGCSQRLRTLYAAAPAAFESSLRFDQVAGGAPRE